MEPGSWGGPLGLGLMDLYRAVELLLKARVVHSAVSRTVPGPVEGATLLYQSGIDFIGLTSESLLALRQLVARLREGPPPA